MPTPLDLSAEILAIAVWTTASSTRRWPPISSTRRMRRWSAASAELTADDFAEGLAVAVAEAERNRDEGTAE